MKLKTAPRSRKIIVASENHASEAEAESQAAPESSTEISLKKILVPVDFSPCSRKAFHYALSFAKQFGSEITLLHVVHVVPVPDAVAPDAAMINAQMQEEAQRDLANWRSEADFAQLKTALHQGVPYLEIIRVADEMKADLIILGTCGRTGFSHLLIGSTAERVVRHAHCPVFVVREREHDFVGT